MLAPHVPASDGRPVTSVGGYYGAYQHLGFPPFTPGQGGRMVCGHSSGTEHDGLMYLLARREVMMMKMMNGDAQLHPMFTFQPAAWASRK